MRTEERVAARGYTDYEMDYETILYPDYDDGYMMLAFIILTEQCSLKSMNEFYWIQTANLTEKVNQGCCSFSVQIQKTMFKRKPE